MVSEFWCKLQVSYHPNDFALILCDAMHVLIILNIVVEFIKANVNRYIHGLYGLGKNILLKFLVAFCDLWMKVAFCRSVDYKWLD